MLLQTWKTHTGIKTQCYVTDTHTLRLNGHFSGEPGLAGCPFNSPSLFILSTHILLGHA